MPAVRSPVARRQSIPVDVRARRLKPWWLPSLDHDRALRSRRTAWAVYSALALCLGSVVASYGLWVAERGRGLRWVLALLAVVSLVTTVVLRKLYPNTG